MTDFFKNIPGTVNDPLQEDLDLDGNKLILDEDGDSYIYSPSDDVIDVVASGEQMVQIDGGNDWTKIKSGYFAIEDGQAYSAIEDTLIPTGTTQNIDFDDSNSHVIDLESATGDVTLTFANAKAGGSYVIEFIQGSTARAITWPSEVKWEGGSAPVISVAEDAIDLISLFYDGTRFLGSALQDLS